MKTPQMAGHLMSFLKRSGCWFWLGDDDNNVVQPIDPEFLSHLFYTLGTILCQFLGQSFWAVGICLVLSVFLPKVRPSITGSEFLPGKWKLMPNRANFGNIVGCWQWCFWFVLPKHLTRGLSSKYVLHRVYPSFCWFYSLTHPHLMRFCCASAS